MFLAAYLRLQCCQGGRMRDRYEQYHSRKVHCGFKSLVLHLTSHLVFIIPGTGKEIIMSRSQMRFQTEIQRG